MSRTLSEIDAAGVIRDEDREHRLCLHWCRDWDGLLIDLSCPEVESCTHVHYDERGELIPWRTDYPELFEDFRGGRAGPMSVYVGFTFLGSPGYPVGYSFGGTNRMEAGDVWETEKDVS